MDQQGTKNFGAFIDRTGKAIRHKYLKVFKEIDVNITTEQWVLLDSLYQNNGQSQNDLAAQSFKNAPTVSRIIDLLCEKGLTERQRFENDRRRYKIYLTLEGKALVEKTYPAVLDLRRQGWDGLSDEDYENFLRIINKIFDNFNGEK